VRTLDPPVAVAAARDGDRRALARLISAVEGRGDSARQIGRLLVPFTGHAHVVGITGAPGVGKSTTTSALIDGWRKQGRTVGVIAVDPSSPFTGGALLGDRVRMSDHSTDEGTFIRSMAARGQLGGLAAATPAAVRVLDACGFDLVVVETVGVGQSEIDIVRCADTVLILQAPGMGDRVQTAKAGLLEIGDVFAVNKSDRPGAAATNRELKSMVDSRPMAAGDWRPPVVAIVAVEATGIAELAEALEAHREFSLASGSLTARRLDRARSEILGLAAGGFQEAVSERAQLLAHLSEQVLAGRLDPDDAAHQVLTDVGVRTR
jgi:LAO/AO transport system kinase